MTELFEIATREDTRPRVGGRPAVPRWAVLAPLPAALAVLSVLVLPLLVTVWRSLHRDGRFLFLAEYAVVIDDDRVQRAVLNSVLWVLFALVLGAAGLGLAELTRRAGGPASLRGPPRHRVARWALRAALAAALALWLLPFLVLVATSLHDPARAAVDGWWSGGLSAQAYRDAFASGELGGALVGTAVRAATATGLMLALALPAAYALAWGGLRRRTARRLAALLAVLAVLPVQVYAGPLGGALGTAWGLGSPTALAAVHAAIGVPFAVLLLRGAFATVPPGEVTRERLDGGERQAAVAVGTARWESVVAVAVLEFVLVWNDLVVGLLLGGPGSRLVTLALLGEARQLATSAAPLAAGAVVVTAVPLLLVLATGRWLIRGLAAGIAR